jgi:hypothetical protein
VLVHSQPSLSLLFQRSRYRSYVRNDNDDVKESEREREEKRREVERYLTTAVGFCIRFERTFRSHFLTAICDIPKRLAATPLEIRIEPFHWGDLLVASPNKEFACVVECKLHAKLQDWQNPKTNDFEADSGYGKLILDEFKNYSSIRYIVLGWKESLAPLPRNKRIQYTQKWWKDLEQQFPRYRPLANDLYMCLTALGVPAFMLKETQHMKLGKNWKALAHAVTLLPAAQIEAGLDEMWPKFDCEGNPSDWYFGVTVKRARRVNTARGKLQKFVKPKQGDAIGWYGYDGNQENAFLSCWFYCANAKAQKNVEARLRRNGINRSYMKRGDEKGRFDVIVQAPLNVATKKGLGGDRSWFSKILKAAMKAD